MNNFYDDFRRAHIDILIKQIVCSDVIHDDKVSDNRTFYIRYKEARKEMSESLYKFFNASDTNDCYLSTEQRYEMFLDIASPSVDDLFQLFFEAGMQSGITFALDMKLIGKTDLFDCSILDKLDSNVSIIRELLKQST